MEIMIKLFPLLAGFYFIAFSLTLSVRNIVSALIFRIIPMFIGLGCLFSGCKLFGWI